MSWPYTFFVILKCIRFKSKFKTDVLPHQQRNHHARLNERIFLYINLWTNKSEMYIDMEEIYNN